MKLILIHGAPSSGKLAVAKSLSKLIPSKVFHNHLTVDISMSIFDFYGQDDFFEFNNWLRRMIILKMHDRGVKNLIMTCCYTYPDDCERADRYIDLCNEHNMEFVPIYLNPSKEEMLRRVISKERVESTKISDPDHLLKLLSNNNYSYIRHKNLFEIDNSLIEPEKVAEIIKQHVETLTQRTRL